MNLKKNILAACCKYTGCRDSGVLLYRILHWSKYNQKKPYYRKGHYWVVFPVSEWIQECGFYNEAGLEQKSVYKKAIKRLKDKKAVFHMVSKFRRNNCSFLRIHHDFICFLEHSEGIVYDIKRGSIKTIIEVPKQTDMDFKKTMTLDDKQHDVSHHQTLSIIEEEEKKVPTVDCKQLPKQTTENGKKEIENENEENELITVIEPYEKEILDPKVLENEDFIINQDLLCDLQDRNLYLGFATGREEWKKYTALNEEASFFYFEWKSKYAHLTKEILKNSSIIKGKYNIKTFTYKELARLLHFGASYWFSFYHFASCGLRHPIHQRPYEPGFEFLCKKIYMLIDFYNVYSNDEEHLRSIMYTKMGDFPSYRKLQEELQEAAEMDAVWEGIESI